MGQLNPSGLYISLYIWPHTRQMQSPAQHHITAPAPASTSTELEGLGVWQIDTGSLKPVPRLLPLLLLLLFSPSLLLLLLLLVLI